MIVSSTERQAKVKSGNLDIKYDIRITMSDPKIKKEKPKIKLTQHDLYELARQLE